MVDVRSDVPEDTMKCGVVEPPAILFRRAYGYKSNVT